MILVSACLLGFNYRYNGGNNLIPELKELLKGKELKAVCPEVEGGLSIPRPPAEIVGGEGHDVLCGNARIKTVHGEDVTPYYVKGSKKMLESIDINDIEFAILKAKSPSCGSKNIYSGLFDGRLKKGSGVGAAYLIEKGIPVFNEKELDKIKKMIND